MAFPILPLPPCRWLPLEGAARLERLFGTLATRSLGERWLQYGAVLLLWLARHAPDYDNKRGAQAPAVWKA